MHIWGALVGIVGSHNGAIPSADLFHQDVSVSTVFRLYLCGGSAVPPAQFFCATMPAQPYFDSRQVGADRKMLSSAMMVLVPPNADEWHYDGMFLLRCSPACRAKGSHSLSRGFFIALAEAVTMAFDSTPTARLPRASVLKIANGRIKIISQSRRALTTGCAVTVIFAFADIGASNARPAHNPSAEATGGTPSIGQAQSLLPELDHSRGKFTFPDSGAATGFRPHLKQQVIFAK